MNPYTPGSRERIEYYDLCRSWQCLVNILGFLIGSFFKSFNIFITCCFLLLMLRLSRGMLMSEMEKRADTQAVSLTAFFHFFFVMTSLKTLCY